MCCIAEGTASARLQQYIAARQQQAGVASPNSSVAANSAFTTYTAAAQQLHIQPLCLTGSPTASSSPGGASGTSSAAACISHQQPTGLQDAAAHAYFSQPGSGAQLGVGSGGGHMGAGVTKQAESVQQREVQKHTLHSLAGAGYAHTRLEPFRPLTDKENSACIAFDEMSMGRQEASSYAEAASELAAGSLKAQQEASAAQASLGAVDMSELQPTLLVRKQEAENLSRNSSGKLDGELNNARSAARRMKLHAMLDAL